MIFEEPDYFDKRNSEIYRYKAEGRTLKNISDHFGICKERVAEIVRKEIRRRKYRGEEYEGLVNRGKDNPILDAPLSRP
jgi:hypothetical protein